MFHVGHLNLLKRAREQCDHLIVGVTTDELCFDRKGKYPIIPYAERVEIVSSIRYVDQVVKQDSMDKFRAWEELRFTKMFVGDDWKGTSKWNEIELKFSHLNVEIIYFPYTTKISSTILREALNKKCGAL